MASLRENAAKLSELLSDHRGFDKLAFHRLGRTTLNQIAKQMALTHYEVRSCKGGPGVRGDVILHTPFVYVMICGDLARPQNVMYRTCNGMTDYSGGQNNFTSVISLGSTDFQATLSRMITRKVA